MIYAFIQYFVAWRRERKRNYRYRYYVTDALRVITENTAKPGKYISSRYADIISTKKKEKPEQTAQEIADGIIKGLRQ